MARAHHQRAHRNLSLSKAPEARPAPVRAFLTALRPHQWIKNSLLFVPLVMAQKDGDWQALRCAALAFLAFCLTASSVYLVNDLVDLSADRLHPVKRKRPFASGAVPARAGYFGAPALMVAGLGIGALLCVPFVCLLAGYIAINFAYSFRLKQLPVLDVLVLAGFYCLRIFAGAFAIDVQVSEWLLAFSLFLFFSLALAKRVSELKLAEAKGGEAFGRGYLPTDLPQLTIFGSVSGYLSVLVYALFINSQHVQTFYRHPQFLWAIFPLLLYWISHVWLTSNRGMMHSDPLVHTLHDRASHVVIALSAIAIFLARGILF